MMRKRGLRLTVLFSLSLLLLAFGCETQEGQQVTLTPFAGGTEGVTIAFDEFQEEVFDKGTFEFPVFVRIENVGERDVPAQDISVEITGFDEFDTPGGTQKNPDELLQGVSKDPQGNVIPGFPLFVEFSANYVDPITTLGQFSVAASACYKYGTDAVTKLCVRRDLQNPAPNGICEVDEAKPSFSSGAPVQITNVIEQPSGSSKIQFKFDVTHTGGGRVYSLGHDCSPIRARQNKVILNVDTGIDGTTCTQLKTREGTAVEGEIDIGAGTRTIFCTVPVPQSDFEFLVNINAEYSYEITTPVQTITVLEST